MKSFYEMMKLMEADELGLGDQAPQTQSQDQAPQDQAPESQDQGAENPAQGAGQPSGEEKPKNYMFFSNLKVIKSAVEEMLSMDQMQVDALLSDGHDWASDHIATSKDDVEEVHQWLKSNMENTGEAGGPES